MKKKQLTFLMMLFLCTSFLFGCGKTGEAQETSKGGTEVVLNEVAHSLFYAPLYVAIEEGYFAEEGIDLTLVTGFGADN